MSRQTRFVLNVLTNLLRYPFNYWLDPGLDGIHHGRHGHRGRFDGRYDEDRGGSADADAAAR